MGWFKKVAAYFIDEDGEHYGVKHTDNEPHVRLSAHEDSSGQIKVVQEGVVDSNNSSVVPLLADGVFTGTSTDVLNYAEVRVSVKTDVASATDGLSIQFSMDETNWDWSDEITILGTLFKEEVSVPRAARYMRIVYTNGSSDQTYFRMSTILSQSRGKPSSHRVKDSLSEEDDAELVKAVLSYQKTNDGTINNVSLQNPLPVDGDSVYAKDVWETESNIGDFSGVVTDLFDNLHSVITNTTSDNPKTLLIHFNKTIISNVIGLGCYGSGNFSNVKIEIVNSGEVYTTVYDDSADGTKYTTLTAQLPVTSGFNAIRITFHTTDTICLSNLVIPKSRSVVSRGQAVKPDGTVIDLNATAGGNQKFSLEEYDETFLTNPLPVQVRDSSGTEINGKFFDERTSTYKGLLFNEGSPQICSQDYLLALSEGDISGHTSFTKFGRVSGVTNTIVDLWYNGTATPSVYVFPTSAIQFNVVSTSAQDGVGGTGILTLRIVGLDSNYDEISETITMNGTTNVTTTNSYLRINACYALTAGSTGSAVGIITIKNTAGTVTYSAISVGLTACRQLIYTVPNGKTLYLTSLTVASGDGGNALKLNAVTHTPKLRLVGGSVFLPAGELLTLNSETVRRLEIPGVFTAKSDIKISVYGDYASASTTCLGAVRGWLE